MHDQRLQDADPELRRAGESAERGVHDQRHHRRRARVRCYHPTLAVYDRSMIANFRQRFMRGREKIRMGILFPTEEEMPNSSLAHYLALAVGNFGTPDSEYLLNQKGLENDLLFRALDEAAATGEPCALLGATYSFVHAFDEMRRGGRRYRLPPGSRILDTGGFKGRSRDVEATEFYGRIESLLGVAASDCINMYGMTELSTQFYDDGNDRPGAPKSGPHWIRTRIVNPLSGADVPPGEQGILVHCDLANYNSAAAIMTEDVGHRLRRGLRPVRARRGRGSPGLLDGGSPSSWRRQGGSACPFLPGTAAGVRPSIRGFAATQGEEKNMLIPSRREAPYRGTARGRSPERRG